MREAPRRERGVGQLPQQPFLPVQLLGLIQNRK
jgi:hypothetical protein